LQQHIDSLEKTSSHETSKFTKTLEEFTAGHKEDKKQLKKQFNE
jgi:hypothetical protein